MDGAVHIHGKLSILSYTFLETPSQTHPDFVSQVILNLVQSTMKMNHHVQFLRSRAESTRFLGLYMEPATLVAFNLVLFQFC